MPEELVVAPPRYRYSVRVSWEIDNPKRQDKQPTVAEQNISVFALDEDDARHLALAWHKAAQLGGRPSVLTVDKQF